MSAEELELMRHVFEGSERTEYGSVDTRASTENRQIARLHQKMHDANKKRLIARQVLVSLAISSAITVGVGEGYNWDGFIAVLVVALFL